MNFHKDKVSIEFKVGIFTIIGILILVLSYAWFTEYITSKQYTEITVRFSNAGNIEKGDDVTILGVKKGRVNEIKVQQDHVLIALRVKLDEPLLEGTSFIINEVDLMGDVQVDITPGKGSEPLDLEMTQSGGVEPGMGKLVVEMSEVVSQLKQVLMELHNEDGMLNSTKAVIDTSLELVSNLKDSFNRNSRSLDLAITRSAELTEQLSEILQENKDNVKDSFTAILDISEELNATLQDLRETSESIRELSDKASTEGSTVNRLISEDDLYMSIKSSVTRLDSLLQDIEDDPKKYFKFSVF